VPHCSAFIRGLLSLAQHMRRLRRWHHIDIRKTLRPILLFASV
jgi:hypothetical protein